MSQTIKAQFETAYFNSIDTPKEPALQRTTQYLIHTLNRIRNLRISFEIKLNQIDTYSSKVDKSSPSPDVKKDEPRTIIEILDATLSDLNREADELERILEHFNQII
jgi:hypothetical protein